MKFIFLLKLSFSIFNMVYRNYKFAKQNSNCTGGNKYICNLEGHTHINFNPYWISINSFFNLLKKCDEEALL